MRGGIPGTDRLVGTRLTTRGGHPNRTPEQGRHLTTYTGVRGIVQGPTRDTYEVLLTRGPQGCIIYSVAPETRQMLASLGVPALQSVLRE